MVNWLSSEMTEMTQEQVDTWKQLRGGRLVCGFCGHHFEAGDSFRFRISQVKRFRNHFVCAACNDSDKNLDKLAKERVRELYTKFAWAVDDDDYSSYHWWRGEKQRDHFRNQKIGRA